MTSRDDSDHYYGTGTPGEQTCPDCGDLLAWSGWRETCPNCSGRDLRSVQAEAIDEMYMVVLRRYEGENPPPAEDVCQQTRTAEGQSKPIKPTHADWLAGRIVVVGWTVGPDGDTATDDYNVEYYFDSFDGHYKGPDYLGVEPIFEWSAGRP